MSTRAKAKATSTTATTALNPGYVAALLHKLRSSTLLQDETDMAALAGIVQTWAYLTERAQRFDLSMAEIRRVLGVLGRPTGRPKSPQSGDKDALPDDAVSAAVPRAGEAGDTLSEPEGTAAKNAHKPADAPPGAGHGRRGETDFESLPVVRHPHNELAAGCACPACARGRIYRFFARTFYSISGQATFEGRRHEIERLQCNVCAEIYDAPLPAAMQADGVGNGRLYTHSAHSAVVLLKYLGVMPWHRQQTVQAAMGVKVPDACMWDMCYHVGGIFMPIVSALKQVAAGAPLLYGDDTSAKILGLANEVKAVRSTGKQVVRTGCHTTAVIAELDTGQKVAVFRIGIQHTGEFLDEILSGRAAGLPAPLVMTDAASCNAVTACQVSMCACNAHALRKFKDLEASHPTELASILSCYRAIFDHDKATKLMSDQDRLAYHREHSRPLFKAMCRQAHALLESHTVEPNSKLGSALDYVLNHERSLSAFFRLPGAPLDNNLTERELRLAVRLRDAAPFYRSERGAQVAAGIWTVLVTALLHGENAFDYFNAVQRYAEDVRSNPSDWLPYNYRLRFAALQSALPGAAKPNYAAARRRAADAAANDW